MAKKRDAPRAVYPAAAQSDDRPCPTIPALRGHPDFPVEWWFCHGAFHGADVPETRFMTAFFRLAGKDGKWSGPMLLVSLQREGDESHRCHSRIGPGLVKVFTSRADEFKRAGIDPTLLDVIVDEFTRYGPPRPIVVDGSPVSFGDCPLQIAWSDFALRQDDSRLTLRFDAPGEASPRETLRLTLTPESRWLVSLDPKALNDAAYISCPRLSLSGTAGGKPVEGTAWFDQQWCETGLFIPDNTKKRLLGLDWIGVNLDDGTDLIVQQRRNVETGRRISPVAVLFEPGREPRISRAVKMSPLTPWTSPHTRIRYPLRWRVALPEERLSLSFTPDCDDQEIPVFGYDAIWEGSGTVAGTRGRKSVRGRARLELDGYGHIFDARKFLEEIRSRVTGHVARKLPRKLPAAGLAHFVGKANWTHSRDFYEPTISGPAWHLLDVGGKQWRSVFVVTLLEALGVPAGTFEYEGVVMAELIHTATLIVDDIEDDSDGRRGVASTHRAYGIDVALNAGNILYFVPLQVLANHPALTPAERDEIYRLTIDYFVRAHFGQAHDIYLSTEAARRRLGAWLKHDVRRELLELYANKTAAPIMALAEMSAIVAGANPAMRAAAVDFARSLGVAFQIMDDVHGLHAVPGSIKTVGEDILLGKLTYLNHAALSMLPAKDRNRLAAILANREAARKPALREAIALVRQSGAIEACHRQAMAMVMRDWRRLSALIPSSRGKTMLRAMWTELLRN
ncbi:MAG: polyprenyl synthetase family protein [Bauldia sp.]|nr:polyprenyl synthetase family protein [Bauldia sp.]